MSNGHIYVRTYVRASCYAVKGERAWMAAAVAAAAAAAEKRREKDYGKIDKVG